MEFKPNMKPDTGYDIQLGLLESPQTWIFCHQESLVRWLSRQSLQPIAEAIGMVAVAMAGMLQRVGKNQSRICTDFILSESVVLPELYIFAYRSCIQASPTWRINFWQLLKHHVTLSPLMRWKKHKMKEAQAGAYTSESHIQNKG